MLQRDWSCINGNMTAYHQQSRASCIGYYSDIVSSSRCVFLCTTACIIFHPAVCPSGVSLSRSTPALIPMISCMWWPCCASHKNSLLQLSHYRLHGTVCRHCSMMTNRLSLHFAICSRLNTSVEHSYIRPSLSMLVTVFAVRVGKH